MRAIDSNLASGSDVDCAAATSGLAPARWIGGRVASARRAFERWVDGVRALDAEESARGVFATWLALVALGLVLQANHAATTLPADTFWSVLTAQFLFRIAAVCALLFGLRAGPEGVRRLLPAAMIACGVCLVLVFVPGFADSKNGANRWMHVPGLGLSFQPSELARVVMMMWVADRCARLGDRVRDLRHGVLPMLAVGFAFFFLIVIETDLGGALLFLACYLATMWVGGARPAHVAGPLFAIGGSAFLILVTCVSYVRHRIAMWLGHSTNQQVDRTAEAIASGDWFGVGLGQGLFRNARVPYLESDYVLALVGEELGLAGILLVLGLFVALCWFGLRLVLSIDDRYRSVSAFGLFASVGLQAMVHVQVVTRLAPPKGMPLPFVSHGGTALVVSSLAIGVALGAMRTKSSAAASARPAQRTLAEADA